MSNVSDYYDRHAGREWQRLDQDAYHSLEFRGTMACLEGHLPGQGLLLDIGGGPGRYAIELCRRGYEVTLRDISPECVASAGKRMASEELTTAAHFLSAEMGDVRDLSEFSDGTFDAVLCLGGTLSHILDPTERCQAVSELARVGKPGMPVFISVIGYLAVLQTVLVRFPSDLVRPEKSQVFTNGDNIYTGGFCDAHFFKPEELRQLAESVGLETSEMCALEGLSSNLPDATNQLANSSDGRWERWLAVLDETMYDPAVLAISEHFMYVGRVPIVDKD